MTIKNVLTHKGINADEGETMVEFKGTKEKETVTV